MSAQNKLQEEVSRRRNFAIISHPDAGKTTLTEKLLLYGGAIHLAGAVKAKKNQKHTTSDWMEIEKQRGISISTTVLQFQYNGYQINLLDTPGHKDFSEDTYRTLMAADAAVMLIDAAKGVEAQTRKLFEVCAMRGIPIFTFVNKMDRPGREPLEIISELEEVLGIRSCPVTWPIGMGDQFRGVYDLTRKEVLFFQTEGEANVKERIDAVAVSGVEDSRLTQYLAGPREDRHEAEQLLETLRVETELLEAAGDTYNRSRVLGGKLTPVFFGSAMNNFGVEHFLQKFIEMAPSPVPRETAEEIIEPTDPRFSGFIFKIQANMDAKHRDRVAFMRICSGKLERGMEVKHARLNKNTKLAMPLNFFGQERVVVEEAWPGDIVGLLDTSGQLRIGDTLCTGGRFEYARVPSFSPEHFATVVIKNPMKRKQLKTGLEQLDEEGVIQLYRQKDLGDKDVVIGAVGALQFEVLQHRLNAEYGVEVMIDKLPYIHARWVVGDKFDPTIFENKEATHCVYDRDAFPVVLFKSDWTLRWTQDNHKHLQFLMTPPLKRES